jgi:hypothetical protein
MRRTRLLRAVASSSPVDLARTSRPPLVCEVARIRGADFRVPAGQAACQGDHSRRYLGHVGSSNFETRSLSFNDEINISGNTQAWSRSQSSIFMTI